MKCTLHYDGENVKANNRFYVANGSFQVYNLTTSTLVVT